MSELSVPSAALVLVSVGTIGGVTPWQKRARLVMAAVAIGVIAVVAYTMRPREMAAPPEKIERIDPTATVETSGGDVDPAEGRRRRTSASSSSGQTTNKEGETKLHGVKIIVDNRDGRSYVVTGKEAFIGKQNSSFDVRGDVKLETSDGLIATGQQATYVDAEKIVRVPGAVKFKRGRMTGSGIGFTFDEQRDTMWILDKADVKFAAEGNAGAMAFTSGAFGYARRDRYMRFEKTMHIDREGQLIDADRVDRAAVSRSRRARLSSSCAAARRSPAARTTSAMRSMTATRHQPRLRRRRPHDAERDARRQRRDRARAEAAARRARSWPANFMDIGLEPDGSVRSLSTRDAVTVDAAGDQGHRGADHSIDGADGRRQRAGPAAR